MTNSGGIRKGDDRQSRGRLSTIPRERRAEQKYSAEERVFPQRTRAEPKLRCRHRQPDRKMATAPAEPASAWDRKRADPRRSTSLRASAAPPSETGRAGRSARTPADRSAP